MRVQKNPVVIFFITRQNSNLNATPFSTTTTSSRLVVKTQRLKQLHARLIRTGRIQDILAVGKLVADIAAFADAANLRYARAVFRRIEPPLNVFVWNSLIRGYAHGPFPAEAVAVYRRMLVDGYVPNNYTYPFVLKACAQLTDLALGLAIHGTVIRRGFDDLDPFVQTSLINLYAGCGSMGAAQYLFDRCPSRDVASWNALIKGYIRCGGYLDAIRLFRRMQDVEKVPGDEITMLNVVSACAHLGSLGMGRWIHAYIDKRQMGLTRNLGTALVTMYSKCGNIDVACSLFEKMREKDVRTWSVMIGGLAVNGFPKKALDLFSRMEVVGIAPDSVTFTSVLSACSHAGLVQEGLNILEEMSKVYLVKPTIEHYGCIVDLLGRAGRLNEALNLIKKIPLQLDVVLWGSLLVACRVHRNIEMGELVAKEMLKLDPCNAGALVFLSNIYASTGKWDQVGQVRTLMKEQKILKPPGSSLIEVHGVIHEFLAGDNCHPQINQIYAMLDEIIKLRSLEVQSPMIDSISFDIDDEDKEQCTYQHSEKLAVALGLISTTSETAIRIVKNLRICEDCHFTMKLVSKAYNRLVIVRDRNRFHHFKAGNCSCGDYW